MSVLDILTSDLNLFRTGKERPGADLRRLKLSDGMYSLLPNEFVLACGSIVF